MRASSLNMTTLTFRGMTIGIVTAAFYLVFKPTINSLLIQFLPLWSIDLIYYSGLFAGLYVLRHRVLPFTLLVAVLILGSEPEGSFNLELLMQERTFFGVYRVERQSLGGGYGITYLFHGTTLHGSQLHGRSIIPEPTTYYHKTGPIGQAISRMRDNRGLEHVGVVGLGAGTLACNLEGDERITFYEIDPAVIKIATTPEYFNYLGICGNNPDILAGDGRLLLDTEPDGKFNLLIIDAFSSDAIPVHLITLEAIDLYLRKVTDRGVVLVHISNRHFDLAPALARIAKTRQLAYRVQSYTPDKDAQRGGAIDTKVVALAADEADLGFLQSTDDWLNLNSVTPGELWTDTFSNLLGAIYWSKSDTAGIRRSNVEHP
jgi:predicted O-methyltransferase YrrM